MNDDSTTLRKRAAHCRRLAHLLLDQKVAAELATFAADLEAEAGRREDETAGRRDHAA